MRLLVVGKLSGQLSTAVKMAMSAGAKFSHVESTAAAPHALRAGQGADLLMVDYDLDIAGLIAANEAERIHVPVVACGVGADPRITRAGTWLRRTKLDELPQLLDVLAGDMSIVGPRPEVPTYVALYPVGLREQVLSVRPGITDPVSLEMADESEQLARAADPEREYREVILPAKLKAAAAYAARATLASDLAVVLRTMALLARR